MGSVLGGGGVVWVLLGVRCAMAPAHTPKLLSSRFKTHQRKDSFIQCISQVWNSPPLDVFKATSRDWVKRKLTHFMEVRSLGVGLLPPGPPLVESLCNFLSLPTPAMVQPGEISDWGTCEARQ